MMKSKEPIADLHCDLLMALEAGKDRDEPEIRCSVTQMREGQVRWQLLPIFVETSNESAACGERQFEIYANFPKKQPNDYTLGWSNLQFDPDRAPDKIQVRYAIESANAFSSEGEPLQNGLDRLASWIDRCGKPAYISLTWKTENRFGGGNESKVGLKPDGKILLDWLQERDIVVDLSHTSDPLAEAILARSGPLIASHSNFRAVCDDPRNLPDDFAKEIIARDGLIGMNSVARFVGKQAIDLVKHIEHGLTLGAAKHLCWGADFFWEDAIEGTGYFFDEMGNSSSYPQLLTAFRKAGLTDRNFLADFCYRNALRYFVEPAL